MPARSAATSSTSPHRLTSPTSRSHPETPETGYQTLVAADSAGISCLGRTIGDGMRREPDVGSDSRDPEVIELGSVPGFVVFDLPGAPVSAGGTRLAPDVTMAEVALLARAMTYKFAVLGD